MGSRSREISVKPPPAACGTVTAASVRIMALGSRGDGRFLWGLTRRGGGAFPVESGPEEVTPNFPG